MKVSSDFKTLIIGILMGLILALVMGQTQTYSGASKADFGISVDRTSRALVRSEDGTCYVIDPQTTKAELIEYKDGPNKGKAFNLGLPLLPTRNQ